MHIKVEKAEEPHPINEVINGRTIIINLRPVPSHPKIAPSTFPFTKKTKLGIVMQEYQRKLKVPVKI